MTLTIEQIKEILAHAPEGELHVNIPIAGGITHAVHRIDDLRTILAQYEEIERLKQANLKALELLDAAACPCCDKSGAYYDKYGEICQCQWCDEAKQLREQSK